MPAIPFWLNRIKLVRFPKRYRLSNWLERTTCLSSFHIGREIPTRISWLTLPSELVPISSNLVHLAEGRGLPNTIACFLFKNISKVSTPNNGQKGNPLYIRWLGYCTRFTGKRHHPSKSKNL